MKRLNNKGFGALQVLVAVFVLSSVGGVGYYVWNKQSENRRLDSISNYAECKADKGSLVQESYPEVCVTKNGKRFTNPDQKAQESTTKNQELSQANIEKAPASLVKFSKLPNELQDIILVKDAGCVKNGKWVNTEGIPVDPEEIYAPIGSAVIGIEGCTGGPIAGLFAKNNKTGKWSFVASTQNAFSCKDIFSNPVPKKLLELGAGAECLDDSSKNLIPYDRASEKFFM